MPLDIRLNYEAISDDCKTVTLKDITGDYDATDNPGGYGNPPGNPDRNTIALFLFGLIYDPTTQIFSRIDLDNLDPANADTWSFESDKDAYYQISTTYVGLYVGGANYSVGDVVYQDSEGLFRSLTGNNTDIPNVSPGTWEVVTEDELFDEIRKKTVPFYLLDLVTSCHAANCYSKATIAISKGSLKENCNCSSENLDEWRRVHVLWNGAVTLILQKRYTEAATVLDTLADICESLDCDCGC